MQFAVNIILYITISGTMAGLWSCYNYCSADWNEINNLGISEKSVCERHGRVFTKAANTYHPGCGTCRCCQRSDLWTCYYYSDVIKYDSKKSVKKQECESKGHIFTSGRNQQYKGCGGCSCCRRKVSEKCLECDTFFTGDYLVYCLNKNCMGNDNITVLTGHQEKALTITTDMLCKFCQFNANQTVGMERCRNMFCMPH